MALHWPINGQHRYKPSNHRVCGAEPNIFQTQFQLYHQQYHPVFLCCFLLKIQPLCSKWFIRIEAFRNECLNVYYSNRWWKPIQMHEFAWFFPRNKFKEFDGIRRDSPEIDLFCCWLKWMSISNEQLDYTNSNWNRMQFCFIDWSQWIRSAFALNALSVYNQTQNRFDYFEHKNSRKLRNTFGS